MTSMPEGSLRRGIQGRHPQGALRHRGHHPHPQAQEPRGSAPQTVLESCILIPFISSTLPYKCSSLPPSTFHSRQMFFTSPSLVPFPTNALPFPLLPFYSRQMFIRLRGAPPP